MDQDEAKMGEDGAKLAPRWAQDGPKLNPRWAKMGQVGPKMVPRRAKLSPRWVQRRISERRTEDGQRMDGDRRLQEMATRPVGR